MAGCGVITRAYRRASRHVRRLIVKSLPSLADDVEMAIFSGENNSAETADPSKTRRPDKGKKRWQKIRFRRSEKKKQKKRAKK